MAIDLMRAALLLCLPCAAICACGQDSAPEPDGAQGNFPPPRVIPGGGIGDGAIDGVVNLYVIDDVTRSPVANATVRVGTLDGTTDATGLFVANDVHGPQLIVAKASGYRSEVWIGANGANITVDLLKANTATPASATVTGQIAGFAALPVTAGHAKVAVVGYSQLDDLGDAANNLKTPNDGNICFTADTTSPCNFTVTTRTGKLALIASIFDRDGAGTMTLIGWAARQGVTTTAGGTVTGQDLTLVSAGSQANVTVNFGTPPSALSTVAGIVGIDIGDEGVVQLPSIVTPAAASFLAPKLGAFSNAAGFRFTGVANNGATPTAQSVVLRRDQTGPALDAGTWLDPPGSATASRTTASWSNVTGATVQGLEYKQGATSVVNITVLDGSTSVTLPEIITLPSGSLTVDVSAIGAPGLDITNFALDTDRDKLAQAASSTVTLN